MKYTITVVAALILASFGAATIAQEPAVFAPVTDQVKAWFVKNEEQAYSAVTAWIADP